MPPNNNLRSVIAQCRNFSTRSRGKLCSSRCNNGNVVFFCKKGSRGAGKRVDSKFDAFMSSLVYGNVAYAFWVTIQCLEYRQTLVRDMKKRGIEAPSLLHDLFDAFTTW